MTHFGKSNLDLQGVESEIQKNPLTQAYKDKSPFIKGLHALFNQFSMDAGEVLIPLNCPTR
jgi:hypothetical protein